MKRRVTISFGDDLIKKLHQIQAKEIRESDKRVTFSQTVNDVLRKCIK
jgi:hypothetical protein